MMMTMTLSFWTATGQIRRPVVDRAARVPVETEEHGSLIRIGNPETNCDDRVDLEWCSGD
jgi:hypothetical protein